MFLKLVAKDHLSGVLTLQLPVTNGRTLNLSIKPSKIFVCITLVFVVWCPIVRHIGVTHQSTRQEILKKLYDVEDDNDGGDDDDGGVRDDDGNGVSDNDGDSDGDDDSDSDGVSDDDDDDNDGVSDGDNDGDNDGDSDNGHDDDSDDDGK